MSGRRRSGVRAPLAGLFVTLVAFGPSRGDRPQLRDVPPLPALEELEGLPREQYRERRQALDRQLEDPAGADAQLARAFGELGMWALAYRYLGSAEPALENAARLAPGDWSWTYYLGHLHRERGDPGRAAAAFRLVLERAPDDVPTLVWLGEMELEAGRPAESAARFDAAVRLDPRCARAVAGQGRVALLGRDPGRAVERLRAALALEPNAPEIHYVLGLAYRDLGDLDRAREHLRLGVVTGGSRRAIPLRDPLRSRLQELNVSADLHARRAREALQAGRVEEGIERFRAAVAAAPENASLRLGLGNALVRAERRDEALREYREALRLEPQNSSAHYNLGLVLEHEAQLAVAEEHYRAALAADPRHARAHQRLGALLVARGERDEALPHFGAAAGGDPNAEAPRTNRAAILLQLGRVGEAVAALETDVSSVPRSTTLQLLLARALAVGPDPTPDTTARALKLAREAFAAAPTILAAETVAMVLAAQGEAARAKEWQEAALAAARRHGLPPETLDRLLRRAALYAKGERCLRAWEADDRLEDDTRVAPPPDGR